MMKLERHESGVLSRRWLGATLLLLGLTPGMATAATMTSTATSTGPDENISAVLTVDDAITPGSLVFSIAVDGDDSKTTIKGFASGLTDGALNGVTVLGSDVTRSFLNLGEGTLGNNPIDPACTTCDLVVSFRKPARGDTDRSVQFTVSDSMGPLVLSRLQDQDFAVLLKVKGDYNRRGAEYGFFFRDSKMVILKGSMDLTPVPEPSTAILLVLGLAGLSAGAHRMREEQA